MNVNNRQPREAKQKKNMIEAIVAGFGLFAFVPSLWAAAVERTDASTAGKWLPAKPPVHDQMRPLACRCCRT
jgi:hypothetical protein